MSSIHYKFKSSLTYDTLKFDGLHISVKDVKKLILQQKQIGKTCDFDLQISNAQTNEVYTDDAELIAKNSSLIVVRVPLTPQQKKACEREANQQLQLPFKFGSSLNIDGLDPEKHKLAKAVDLSKLDASEDDKIFAMMTQSSHAYDPSNYIRVRGSNQVGEVPANYRCYKCHQPGHWIKDCRLNSSKDSTTTVEIRKSTGIPRSFMIPVESSNVPGAMITPSGQFAVPQIDHQAYQEASRRQPPTEDPPVEKPSIPDDLTCSICHDLLTDAVMIPCCGNSFCDECIRNTLLDSDDHQCPDCKECSVSPDTLIPNRFLRNAVNAFRNQTGYHGRNIVTSVEASNKVPTIIEKTAPIHEPQQITPIIQPQEPVVNPTQGAPVNSEISSGQVSLENTDRIVKRTPPLENQSQSAQLPSQNIAVTLEDSSKSPAQPTNLVHPPPPGNIHHPNTELPIQTIGSSQPHFINPIRLDNLHRLPNNNFGPSQIPSHITSQTPRYPIQNNYYSIPTGVEEVPSIHPMHMGVPLSIDGLQKTLPLAHMHRSAIEERAGTPTVDEKQSNMTGQAIPDTSQVASLHQQQHQQASYPIPSFPPTNRQPHYGYGPPPGMAHTYPQRGPIMHPYGNMPHHQGYPMDNMRGSIRGYRGYMPRGRSRGMHQIYRGGPPNGSQIGTIDDPLAAFEKMLKEKDNRDRRRRRQRSFSRSRSKSPYGRDRRRSHSRSYARSISRSKSRTRSHSRSRTGSPRSRSRTPRSRTISRSPSRSHRGGSASSRSRSIKSRRSRTRSKTRSRSRTPRSRTRSRSQSVRQRSKTPPPPKKKKRRSRSHSGSYSLTLSRSRSRSLSRSLSPRNRDKDRRYSPHRRGTSHYRSPQSMRSPSRNISRYNKEHESMPLYHDQVEYGHRGYYRGRGRGRYQSGIRKAMGRMGPPGTTGPDAPPSYYNTNEFSSNRYSGDRYDPNYGGRYHHQGQKRYEQYDTTVATVPEIPSVVSSYRTTYSEHQDYPPSSDHRARDRDTSYHSAQREMAAKDWERDRAREYDDRYNYSSSRRQHSRSSSRERHRKSREKVKENETQETSLKDSDINKRDDSRALSDIKKETVDIEKKKDKDSDDLSPKKKEKKKKKKEGEVDKKKKKKKERRDVVFKNKTVEENTGKPAEPFINETESNTNLVFVKTEPAVNSLYGDLEDTRIDLNVVENYGKVSETLPSTIDSSVIQVIEPTNPTEEIQTEGNKVLTNTIEENVMLAPIPEISKWELDEELVASDEKITGETDPDSGEKKVVTSEVLKRAENVIFQKAVNALRSFDVKRSSLEKNKDKNETSPMAENEQLAIERTDGSKESRKPSDSIQVTVPVESIKLERSVEVASVAAELKTNQKSIPSKSKIDRSKVSSSSGNRVSPVRISAKERLGAKVDDFVKINDNIKRVRSTVERKSRSRSPKRYGESKRSSVVSRDRHKDRITSPSRGERRVILGTWPNRDRLDKRFYDQRDKKYRDNREKDRKGKERRSRSSSHDRKRERKHYEKKSNEVQKTADDKKSVSNAPKKDETEKKEKRKVQKVNIDKKKVSLDEASFEPDYDETELESEPETPIDEKNITSHDKSESPNKKRSRSNSVDRSNRKKSKIETGGISDKKQDADKLKTELETGESSETDSSSDSSSDSSVEIKKKKKKKRSKKKKKKTKKKRKDSSSDSESSDSSSSGTDEEKNKKKKHKSKSKKNKKKKKKSKHK